MALIKSIKERLEASEVDSISTDRHDEENPPVADESEGIKMLEYQDSDGEKPTSKVTEELAEKTPGEVVGDASADNAMSNTIESVTPVTGDIA